MNTNIAKLTAHQLNPTTPAVGSVIWLHGLGADGNDFVPIVPELKLPSTLPLRFIFPNAPSLPVTINGGYVMPAWYDIYSLDIDNRADKQGLQTSVLQITQLIEHEIAAGIPAKNIVLAGFSQGAVVALHTGLRFSKPLGGIMALSGYLPAHEELIAEINPANSTTPIFLAHGTQDTVVPLALGELAYQQLLKQNLPVSWHSYRMEHSVCGEEIQEIAAWLQNDIF